MNETFDIKTVKVRRTTEGTIFEVVFLVLLLAVWGVTAWLVSRAPDVVPTHFGPSGAPDAYGSPWVIVVACIVLTVAAISMMVCAYYPRFVNMPVAVTNMRQVALIVRMVRVLGLLMLLLTLAIVLSALALPSHSAAPIILSVVVMLVVCVGFSVKVYRIHNGSERE